MDKRSLAHIRCFLLDMDGTIYLGDRLLEGTLEFLEAVTRSGREYYFLTNNSSKSAAYYVRKLAAMGITVPPQKVLTSGQATGHYLLREHAGKRVFLLGNEELAGELSAMGITLCKEDAQVVTVGFDTTLTYASMTQVCNYVRVGLPFVATHPDFNCPVQDGFIPDIGAILAFIEASAGRRPDVIVGKPHGEIVRYAMERTGQSAQALAICGDRLYTDIRTGVDHGLTSVLVFTGEAKREELAHSPIQPTIALERLSDLIAYL